MQHAPRDIYERLLDNGLAQLLVDQLDEEASTMMIRQELEADRSLASTMWHCTGAPALGNDSGASPGKQWTTHRLTLNAGRTMMRWVFRGEKC